MIDVCPTHGSQLQDGVCARCEDKKLFRRQQGHGATTVEIPLPPSANRMYRKMRNMMIPHPDYLLWMKLAADIVREAYPSGVGVPCELHIEIYGGKGFREGSDLDNCLKAICDMLTPKEFCGKRYGAGVIEDDNVTILRHISMTYFERRETWFLDHETEPRVKDLAQVEPRCYIYLKPFTRIPR